MKLLYLVLRQVASEWKTPREWCEAKTQFRHPVRRTVRLTVNLRAADSKFR
jgi:hypothetical protein